MVEIKKVYTPNPENKAVYARQYEKYKKLFQVLDPVFEMDAEDLAKNQVFMEEK